MSKEKTADELIEDVLENGTCLADECHYFWRSGSTHSLSIDPPEEGCSPSSGDTPSEECPVVEDILDKREIPQKTT